MIGQPTVNDLASVFRGNPGPLQARVNQDMQGQPPGALPKDLADVLALQIVTNEQDAAKRNAAMQQLQQMQAQAPQGPQGEPPTIAQSLQEQAKQKLQAQMMQQMRQQQGLQALAQQAPMGAIPEQTPQPQEQPEATGLDMLVSNMGENYAGGGIIAFNGEDNDQEVPRPIGQEVPLSPAKRTQLERELLMRLIGETERARNTPPVEQPAPERESEIMRAVKTPFRAIGEGIKTLYSGTGANQAPMGAADQDLSAAIMAAAQQPAPARSTKGGAPATPDLERLHKEAITRGDSSMSASRVPTPNVEPSRAAPPRASLVDAVPPSAPPAAPPAAAPAQPPLSEREKYLAAQITPAPRPEVGEQEYETKIGQRPTADLAALADEIAARRQALRSRADPMMDFLRGVAMAPRGEKWMQSGVRGGMYADELRAAREAQDMELLQKLMETKGKITDIEYGYKKEKYAAGRDAVKTAVDRANKAAELLGFDERQRAQLVATAGEKALDRQTQIDVAKIHAAATRAGFMKPSEAERVGAEYRRILKEQGQKAADDFLESEQRVRAAVGGVKYEGQDRDVANRAKVYEILNKDDAYKMERDVIRRLEAKEKRTPKEEQRLASARTYVQNEYNRINQSLYGTEGGGGGGARVISEADIQATMRSSGQSREAVIAAAKARGYTIQ